MSTPRLRIAQVAPPLEAVPPPGYGGTERVVDVLVRELVRRGHDVTLFASGDSLTPARLVPTVGRALRPEGLADNPTPYVLATLDLVLRHDGAFDVVHAHLGWAGVVLARMMATPVVNTFHSRLDEPWAAAFLADPPPGLVAVSAAQASPWPAVDWTVVHNGLDLDDTPFGERPTDDLCFVGRFTPDKGVAEAVAIARATGRRLRIAAKAPATAAERAYYDDVFLPATRDTDVEYLGELARPDCDRLFAESFATLMPGDWPEPFGLVAIESLACGTPVVAHGLGALPEIVRDGIDGILAPDPATLVARFDEVDGLDRRAIRTSVLERFSAGRMADGYEAAYARALERSHGTSRLRPVMATPSQAARQARPDRRDRSG